MKNKYPAYNFIVILLLLLVTSCGEERLFEITQENGSDELPVMFDMMWPDEPDSRAYFDQFGNERFENNDLIHIVGTFKTRKLKEDGEYEYGVVSRYGALRYDGKNWVPADGSQLTWPSISTSGTFEAYYIAKSSGIFTETQNLESFLLADLTSTSDPLYAKSRQDIEYGYAVKMEFSHICAHLTLTDVEPEVSDVYWFTRPGDLKDQEGNPVVFNNAFQISLEQGNNGPALNFSFIQIPNPDYNLVYISGDAVSGSSDDGIAGENTPSYVDYFLEPGYYDTFTLVYPTTGTTTYDYLEYKFKTGAQGTDEERTPPDLKANTPYILNISKATGVTIVTPPSEGGWDEEGDYWVIVDVEEFLKHATNGEDYTETDKETGKQSPILEKTIDGCKLLRNVDFHNFRYYEFKDKNFIPDLNKEFEGGQHYIRNMAEPLFHFNNGTIVNLGIRSSDMDIVSVEDDDENKDNSRNGSICHLNRGTIENIRVIDLTMNVAVDSNLELGSDGKEAHNIGGVTGSNTGKVSDVALGGAINIVIEDYKDKEVNASVLIGGIIGQNAGGMVSNISALDETLIINITNESKGTIGDYAIGGVVGQGNGTINGVILKNVTIDSSKSSGVTSYIGGLVGNLTASEVAESGNYPDTVEACIISGSVAAGITKPYGDVTSVSYTGGMVGVVAGIQVLDSRSAMNVAGAPQAFENVIFGTGGCFGRIRNSTSYQFANLIAYGSSLTGPTLYKSYRGNFAGIVPAYSGWDDWFKSFDTQNILVNSFTGIPLVGEALTDDNQPATNP